VTRWEEFQRRWKNCTACPLYATRDRIVLARGELPCDVLFIGEAPGRSEDALGKPFIGPAGRLLQEIVRRALEMVGYAETAGKEPGATGQGRPPVLSCAFTNVVCCIPLDEYGEKTEAPPDEAIRACSVRLLEFVEEVAKPKLLVCVGSVAKDWLDPTWKRGIYYGGKVPQLAIVHPASILRSNFAQQGFAVQRCVVQLANAFKQLGQS
jgi:DNA polymerase